MDPLLAQEQLGGPARQELQNPGQVNHHVEVVLEAPRDLRMQLVVRPLNLLEDHEHLRRDIVQRVEHLVHELVRDCVVAVEQDLAQLPQEKLRVSRVHHTSVYVLLEATAFGEPEEVLDGVALPSAVVEGFQDVTGQPFAGVFILLQGVDAVLEL